MLAEELLVLNYGDFSNRVDNLYLRLKSSAHLRELFVRNPTRVLFGTLTPGIGSPSDLQAAISNRFLFSLFSNQKFLEWTKEYGRRLEEKIFAGLDQDSSNKDRLDRLLSHVIEADKRTIYKEFLEAMLHFGDTTILNSFATSGSKFPHPLPSGRGDNEGYQVPSQPDPDIGDPATRYSVPIPLAVGDPIAANLDQNGNVYAVPLVYVAVLVVILVAVPALTYAGIT